MLSFAQSFGAWALTTTLPALLGLGLIQVLGGLFRPRYGAAFGLGIFLWFFIDTIQGSSDLLVNEGFRGGPAQAAVVLLFVAGLLVFVLVDRNALSSAQPTDGFTRFAPFLVALAVGVHGLGEGLAFGYTASQTASTDLLGAFGGFGQGAAYAMHKALETMMAGAIYVAYSSRVPRPASRAALDLVSLTVVFALPSLLGAAAGYYAAFDATFAYALGGGAAAYVALRLGREALLSAEAPSRKEALKVAIALLAGFILIYSAALLHNYVG